MKFTFGEAELINNYYEDEEVVLEKDVFIKRLKLAILHTNENELIEVAENIISKIILLDNKAFEKLITNLPLDPNTTYNI